MYSKLTPQWAGTLLGLVQVALIPIPFVFYKWGTQIRAKSPLIRQMRADAERSEKRAARAARQKERAERAAAGERGEVVVVDETGDADLENGGAGSGVGKSTAQTVLTERK